MGKPAVRFVVSKIDWVRAESDGPYFRRTARTAPVAEFAAFDEAETDRRRREAELRATVNPFRYGGAALFYQTALDAPRLHDWLMDAGIEPPKKTDEHAAWISWWKWHSQTWTDEQRAHVWAALDKVQFFLVIEEHPRSRAYVIVDLHWRWCDEPTVVADYEGGQVVKAFRTKAAAEEECARLNRKRQAQGDHDGFESFTRAYRIGEKKSAPDLDISETIFFEVVEIEVEDEA
jgi:hypothetical protein